MPAYNESHIWHIEFEALLGKVEEILHMSFVNILFNQAKTFFCVLTSCCDFMFLNTRLERSPATFQIQTDFPLGRGNGLHNELGESAIEQKQSKGQ